MSLSFLSPMQRRIVWYFRVSLAVKAVAIVGLLLFLKALGVV